MGSYPTISPLPFDELLEHVSGGIFSVTLSVTRDVKPEYPHFREESYPVVSGLSSPLLWNGTNALSLKTGRKRNSITSGAHYSSQFR